MLQFNAYERYPREFANGFDERYARQIEPASNGEPAKEDRITLLAEALAWVLEFCWTSRGGAPQKQPRTAIRRFVALSMTMRPDLIPMTFREMAGRMRISKSLLSSYSVGFSDTVGLQFRPNRRKHERRINRNSSPCQPAPRP